MRIPSIGPVLFLLAAPVAAARPNVVVIMADDLDEPTLEVARAIGFVPNIEKLEAAGARFSNSFVSNSLCCPSRATFLTGQYSHGNGVWTNEDPEGTCTRLDDRETLATWLHAAGYRTGIVGKYLNGYGEVPGAPDCRNPRYVPPGWDDWQVAVGFDAYRMYGYTLNDNGSLVSYGQTPGDYETDVVAVRARDFIMEAEASDAQPFFLYVAPLAPHQEANQPLGCADSLGGINTVRAAPRHEGTAATVPFPSRAAFSEADISDKPAWMQGIPAEDAEAVACLTTYFRDRLEAVRGLDDLVGSIVQDLTVAGEMTDTVVVFTSDNGYLLGEHRLSHKTYAYEEAIRVPLTVVFPGAAARTIDRYVVNTDLAATICDVAGATAGRTADGRSFAPLCTALRPPAWRRRFLLEHVQGTAFPGPDHLGVRTAPIAFAAPRETWVAHLDGSRELYDLAVDPDQLASLHADPSRASQRAELARALAALSACGGGTCPPLEFTDPRADLLGALGAGPGNESRIRAFDASGGTSVEIVPFASSSWGAHPSSGVLDAAGYAEILACPGPGPTLGPQVRAFDASGTPRGKVNFFAYGTLRSGCRIAGLDADGDAFDEILTGPGPGSVFGPHVRAFDVDGGGVSPIAKVSFFAYGTLRFGAGVRGGDPDGDLFAEMLTGPGPGVSFGPQVRGFDFDGAVVEAIPGLDFFAFGSLAYGAEVASADVEPDSFDEILCAPGPGPSPAFPARFRGFDFDATAIAPIAGFDVVGFTGTLYGGRVTGADRDLDGRGELSAGAGPDPTAATEIRSWVYAGGSLLPLASVVTFPGRVYGINVASGYLGM